MKTVTSELQHKKMTETPITRLLVSLSLPSVANMLLSSIYNMADTYFVTSLGESAIGGVGIVFSIQSIIQSVGFGVSTQPQDMDGLCCTFPGESFTQLGLSSPHIKCGRKTR